MNYLDQPSDMNRRVFVKGLGLVSLGLVTSAMFGGCEQLIKDIQNRPVRRYLRTGSPEVQHALDVYREAVIKMRALPDSDPRSWNAQAALHGTVSGGFNLCQHGTVHFFSWHRAYLLYFERICQQLTGEKSFGLPYWNWNRYPAMHPAFTAAGSALDHPRSNTTVGSNAAFNDPTMTTILSDANFITFSSQLEGTPHNTAHVIIGMDMGTGGSPQDPIFWAHHCMVDYCWAKWNIELEMNNTNDGTWIGHANSHFVDADGNPAEQTAGITTIEPLLSYRYESSAIGSAPAEAELTTKADFEKVEQRVRAGANIRFEVKQRVRLADKAAVTIARPFSKETKLAPQDFAAVINSDTARERVFASIDFARVPPQSDFAVRVFVNLPNANKDTRTEDPHFAGAFAFFGTHSEGAATTPGGHQHQPKFLVNLTNTIQRLRSSGQLNEGTPISLQLVPTPFAGKFEREDTQLELNGIEIITTPVIINPPPVNR